MNVLIDTDVLIDVALDRKPFVDHSAAVLDLAENRQFKTFIAWHSLANFYYLVSSSSNKKLTKDFLTDLLQFAEISITATKDAQYAVDLKIADFEDALQIAAARACGAELILTRNIKHYKNSPITARTPEIFIKETKITNQNPERT